MQRLGVQCNGAPPRVQQQEAVQAQVLQPGVVAGAPQAAPNGNGDSQQPEADTLIEFRNVWKSFGRWACNCVLNSWGVGGSAHVGQHLA